MNYNKYLGFDISKSSISRCISMFSNDSTKSFMLYTPFCFVNKNIKADLVVCLDVLYHVIDENDFEKLIKDIFSFDPKYVILYTTVEEKQCDIDEMLFRNPMPFLRRFKNYTIEVVKNSHEIMSAADFIFLTKVTA